MSRMTTSRASLSWARPAMRRACSSDVSRFRLLDGTNPSLAIASVEPTTRDLGRDRRGNEPVDRLATRDASPDLARGHVERLDLEELDAVCAIQTREHAVQPLARIARASPSRS